MTSSFATAPRVYVAREGDRLSTIVWQLYGDPTRLDAPPVPAAISALLNANPRLLDLPPPYTIPPGTRITVPLLSTIQRPRAPLALWTS